MPADATGRTMVTPDLIEVVAEAQQEIRALILLLNHDGVAYAASYAEDVAHGSVNRCRVQPPAGMPPRIAAHLRDVVLDSLLTTRRVPPSVLSAPCRSAMR